MELLTHRLFARQPPPFRALSILLIALGDCPLHGDAQPWLVFLSYMEPLSTLHLRTASIAVHRHLPNARVALSLWQEIDPDLLRSLRRKLRVAAIASTTLDAVEAAIAEPARGGRGFRLRDPKPDNHP